MRKICSQCNKPKKLSEFYFRKGRNQYYSICKKCYNFNIKEHRNKYPWKRVFNNINSRCNNPNEQSYLHYGGRGIKCLITEEELKFLWFRDKAYLMEKPSIDREDNNDDYILSNCRFIEFSINTKKDKYKQIIQYSLTNHHIRVWGSIKEASKKLKINDGNISQSCKKIRKSAGGFIWRYSYVS